MILVVACLVGLATPSIGALQQPQNVQSKRTVHLNVLVTDLQNRPLTEVKQEEFSVFEDDVPQTITYFSKSERPLVYCLLMDTSGSLKPVINPLIDSAKIIVNSSKPADAAALIAFNEMADLLAEFSSETGALLRSLDDLRTQARGSTAVLDALFLATEYVTKYQPADTLSRRAIILLTDGQDRENYYKTDEIKKILRKENVQIFAVGIRFKEDSSNQKQRASKLLQELTQETGGQVFFATSSKELQSVAGDLLNRLRSQYIIGYKPVADSPKNSYHKVKVAIADAASHDKRIVITRTGYTLTGK